MIFWSDKSSYAHRASSFEQGRYTSKLGFWLGGTESSYCYHFHGGTIYSWIFGAQRIRSANQRRNEFSRRNY